MKGIRRNYAAIEVAVLDHEKWNALTWAERGQWLAVRLLAERQTEVGAFVSKATLAILLRKEGVPKAEDVIEKLIAVRLLDESEDGRIRIHDREDWRPETSTERVKEWREKRKLSPETGDNPPETVENSDETNETFHPVSPPETFHSVSEHEGTARGEERREEKRRVLEPLTPLKRGTRGSRANGTNPRAVAALAREARKREKRDLHFSYLRGEMTEAEFTERSRAVDVDRPSSQAS